MKTYLVTGGAGFIGSNYIQYMFETYKEEIFIINVDTLTYAGNLQNLKCIENNKNYKFIKGDICDENHMQQIFSSYEIDYVIHFAAESHVDRSIMQPSIFARTNVLGTVNLLNMAKDAWGKCDTKGKKFVHISTDEVYGSLGEKGFFTEKTPLNPHSPYSASKASSDLMVQAYADTYKLPINITRCSNNYGEYQFPEKLIPLMINNVLNGKDLPVYGDGKNIRDWLYVKDHVRAIDMVTRKGIDGEVYNIGGHNEKENIEVVTSIIETVLEILKPQDKRREKVSTNLIKYVEDRKGHDRRYAIDPSKIEKEVGWKAEIFFKDGIVKTIEWYLNNAEWIKAVTSKEYQKYY